MTADPETVRPTDPLAFVLHKMDGGGYRHLPVVQNGCVLGMLSVRDMLKHITRLCKAGCGGGRDGGEAVHLGHGDQLEVLAG